jgi:hypothetical protein
VRKPFEPDHLGIGKIALSGSLTLHLMKKIQMQETRLLTYSCKIKNNQNETLPTPLSLSVPAYNSYLTFLSSHSVMRYTGIFYISTC